MGRKKPCRLVLPWISLTRGVDNDRDHIQKWAVETKPEEQGLVAGTNWCVASVESIQAFGVAVHDPRVFFALTWPKSFLGKLINLGYFEIVQSPEDVDLTKYAHTAIIDLESYNEHKWMAILDFEHGDVLVQRKVLSAKDSIWL